MSPSPKATDQSKALISLTVQCPAKINLYLNTLRKRLDGYHEIESIFHAISLFDQIQIIRHSNLKNNLQNNRTKHLKITISSHSTFSVKKKDFYYNNIMNRVYKYFRLHYGIPELEVILAKNIPVGAGLGGGSSDAAGLILGINRMFRLKLSQSEMMLIGAGFGSDVPFFFTGGMAWVKGRGDIIEKHPLALNQKFLLCYPNCSVETARSYKEFNTLHPRKSIEPIKKQLFKVVSKEKQISDKRKKMFDFLSRNLFNSFEEKTLKSYHNLNKIRQIFKKKAVCSLMSGSGSSFYALFHDIIKLDETYSSLKMVFPNTFKVKLISSGVKISESKFNN